MMKTRNYYRPSTVSLGKKKRVFRRKSGARFLLKLFLFFFLAGGIVLGGWWVVSHGYQMFVQARISDWQVKQIVVSGVTGALQDRLLALARPYEHKSFTIQDAIHLRADIIKRYPMLKEVSVKRGMLNGKLSVSASHRTPLAKFLLPEGNVKYIDADSTVYVDPYQNSSLDIPLVELEGTVPEKLGTEFVELVESTLKLKKELPFSFLRMNLTRNTVKMYLPDGIEIDFGLAIQLKKKAARAAQILALARQKYPGPFVLKFQFFESGKVFLTQKAH